MTHIKETDITRNIQKLLREHGALPVKFFGGLYAKKGISDLLVCFQGRYVAIEVKRPGGKVSPEQAQFLQAVRQHGGLAFVAYSPDDVVRELGLPSLFNNQARL